LRVSLDTARYPKRSTLPGRRRALVGSHQPDCSHRCASGHHNIDHPGSGRLVGYRRLTRGGFCWVTTPFAALCSDRILPGGRFSAGRPPDHHPCQPLLLESYAHTQHTQCLWASTRITVSMSNCRGNGRSSKSGIMAPLGSWVVDCQKHLSEWPSDYARAFRLGDRCGDEEKIGERALTARISRSLVRPL
jgi:hypothetical protein